MKDIVVLYSVDDMDDFVIYLDGLFKKGHVELDIKFQPIEDLTDLAVLKEYKILLLICSPCIIEFFDDESETRKFQKCFQSHPCIVCFQYYAEDDDVSRLQTALSLPKGWKLFQNTQTTEGCKETIASIFDIYEEQIKLPPRPKEMVRKVRKSRRAAKIIPSTVYKAHEQVAVIFQKPPAGIVQISFEGFDKIIDAKQFNETTYLFRVPLLPKFGEIRLTLLCNNEKTADCMLKIVKPNLAAYQCLDFIAQSLAVDPNNKEALDAKLVNLFDKSIPGDGTLAEIMKLQTTEMPFSELIESDQEIPTLLHFAAKHGLEELACTIMDTPGSSAAFQIENKDGYDPADVAEINDYVDLAEHMRTHFETHTMVEYIHLAMDNIYSNQDDLVTEREQNADKNRPQSLEAKSTQHKPMEQQKSVTLPRSMKPQPPLPIEEEQKYSKERPQGFIKPQPPLPSTDEEKTEKQYSTGMNPKQFMGMKDKPLPDPKSLQSSTHTELLEIGNAVRDGEFTVDEAERLYASWVDRNKATQSKSLKERSDAIKELREQYQTVFKPVKEKRESIFTKLKQKVSPRKKSGGDEPTYSMQITHLTLERERKTHNPGRESLISNSSSSSGGSRGSTLSQSSWRDSNIGSMQEDSDSEIDDTPVYGVQRRESDAKENQLNRISLRDQFLKQIEEESPELPPRPAVNIYSRSVTQTPPPPPRKDRLPPPIPTSSSQHPTNSPIPEQQGGKQIPSPISRRPPIPIPEQSAPATAPKPSVKLPPRPRPEHSSQANAPQTSVKLPPKPPPKQRP